MASNEGCLMKNSIVIYVIDDDPGVRNSLKVLLTAEKYVVQTFESPNEFLEVASKEMSGCLILDIRMPEMNGLEVQENLLSRGIEIPIIFITAHGDVSTAVRAMKSGSFDFIEKPFSGQVILNRIYKAIDKDCNRRAKYSLRMAAQEKLNQLTEREKEVLILVVKGKPSKVIADVLGLSVSTIDNHRAKIMKKLEAETTADITRITLLADPNLIN